MSCCDHSAPRWRPEPRCTRCGHRTGNPVPTRLLPARLWPFELATRLEARLRRRFLEATDGND